MGDGLVELLVVVVLQVGLRALPHGEGGVDLPASLSTLPPVRARRSCVVQVDGKGDVVGVLPDDPLDPPAVRVLRTLFVEVQESRSSQRRLVRGLGDLVFALPSLSISTPSLPQFCG